MCNCSCECIDLYLLGKLSKLLKKIIFACFPIIILGLIILFSVKTYLHKVMPDVWAGMVFHCIIILVILILVFYFIPKKRNFRCKLAKWHDDKKQAEICLKEFKEAIDTQRALMISGPWGVGKTVFYHTSIHPELSQEYPFKDIFYVSCFYVQSVDDLIKSILNKAFGIEFLIILFYKAKSILTASTNFKQALIPANSIIVFDDFERLPCGDNNHNNILGLFNYLIQEKNCHIIVICNKKELETIDGKYNKFFEKTIKEHEFKLSEENIKQLLEQYRSRSEYHGWIFSDKFETYIFNLFKHNARLAMFVLSDVFGQSENDEKTRLFHVVFLHVRRMFEGIADQKKYTELYFNEYGIEVLDYYAIKNAHREEEYWRIQKRYNTTKSDVDIGNELRGEFPFFKELSEMLVVSSLKDRRTIKSILDNRIFTSEESLKNCIIYHLVRIFIEQQKQMDEDIFSCVKYIMSFLTKNKSKIDVSDCLDLLLLYIFGSTNDIKDDNFLEKFLGYAKRNPKFETSLHVLQEEIINLPGSVKHVSHLSCEVQIRMMADQAFITKLNSIELK